MPVIHNIYVNTIAFSIYFDFFRQKYALYIHGLHDMQNDYSIGNVHLYYLDFYSVYFVYSKCLYISCNAPEPFM